MKNNRIHQHGAAQRTMVRINPKTYQNQPKDWFADPSYKAGSSLSDLGSYSVHRKILRLSNYSLINFSMVRAASLYCVLNIDLSRTIVGRIFHFSSSNSTQGLVWVYNRTNRVDGSRKIFRRTLYNSPDPPKLVLAS